MVDDRTPICIDEAAPNGGLHEVFTKDGSVRFFLEEGEEMSKDHRRLLIENADLNIAAAPPEQRKAMEERIHAIRKRLRA